MSIKATRPEHLPDFRNPPLNEVVLGVQFGPPQGYQQIYAGEVWNLFRKEFPKVEEQPPLVPSFETFGLPSKGRQIGLVTGASHDRFWFLREDGDELIQFQQDRLLHNWRKVGEETNEYPRFESMVQRFRGELEQVQDFMNGLASQRLTINQCEISYINHIAPSSGDEAIRATDWLRFVTFEGNEPDDFAANFREIIHDDEGKPQGRLVCEATTGLKADRQRLILMTLTVRGAPKGSDIESALDFLAKGRDLIVCKFAEVTTEAAHKKWGRIR